MYNKSTRETGNAWVIKRPERFPHSKPPMRKVIVKPISSKAKNTFVNTLNSNPVFTVEQDTGGELFLASENRKYFMWVSTRTGTNRFGSKKDTNWEIITEIEDIIE